MKIAAKYLLWIGILAALATPAFAETRTISWDPVTTYTDNTPIDREDGQLPGLLEHGYRAVGGIPPHHRHFPHHDLHDIRSWPAGDDPRHDRLLHGEGRSEHRRRVGALPHTHGTFPSSSRPGPLIGISSWADVVRGGTGTYRERDDADELGDTSLT